MAKYDKDKIISEIKRIAMKLGKKSLSISEFKKYSNISRHTVCYYFISWNEAVKEAGLEPIDPIEKLKLTHSKNIIPEEDLLKDLIRLFNETGKIPTMSLIDAKGKYSASTYSKKFKTIPNAFQLAKKSFQEDFQNTSQEIITDDNVSRPIETEIKIIPNTIIPEKQNKKRIVFGEPINFRGLRFAPINEQGVVYLFGMVSRELGFLIESVRTEYPDCEGKRCCDKEKSQWEHIQIEFEYSSSNFLTHSHNIDECDLIVCWKDDWNECPIEVLELKNVIKYLGSK